MEKPYSNTYVPSAQAILSCAWTCAGICNKSVYADIQHNAF